MRNTHRAWLSWLLVGVILWSQSISPALGLAPDVPPGATPTPRPTPTRVPVARTSTPRTPSRTPSRTPPPAPTHELQVQEAPGGNGFPTLSDYWDGRADFVVDVPNTGLPMGESDTLVMRNSELWSYLHASSISAGIVDRCGDPAAFPGCVVIYRSSDGGRTFAPPNPPVCLFECGSCPCTSERDHTDQQQYPRVAYNGKTLFMVYEYRGRVRMRRSADGLIWSPAERAADTGIWKLWLRSCRAEERIGSHPYVPPEYDCLTGGPPGLYLEGNTVYVFVALGQNPGSMGCYVGATTRGAESFTRCTNNPLFTGATEYGPGDLKDAGANPYFDFRTISSAEVQKIGDRYYMLYEGVRGPGPGDPGDTQFAIGLARSLTAQIDGPWEKYPFNPILVNLPGNIGAGHADLVVLQGETYLYTSLDGVTRSRLVLRWK